MRNLPSLEIRTPSLPTPFPPHQHSNTHSQYTHLTAAMVAMSFQCSRRQILSSHLHRENPPIRKQNELLIVPFCSWCLAYLITLFQRFSKLICQNFDFSQKLIITTNFSMRLTPSPISFLRFELHHICFKKNSPNLRNKKERCE